MDILAKSRALACALEMGGPAMKSCAPTAREVEAELERLAAEVERLTQERRNLRATMVVFGEACGVLQSIAQRACGHQTPGSPA